MEFLKFAAVAVIAYLLGSLNFGVIISHLFFKKDIRTMGSGNAGTTNALRVMGAKLGSLVFIGDIIKGVLAGLIGRALGDDGEIVAMFFVILGHVFPVYFGFRGGKGILTTAAVIMVFDWRIALIAIFIFAVIVSLSRLVSLGSITAAAMVPVLMLVFHPTPWWYTVVAVILGGGEIFLHRGNIKRLIAGTESRLSIGKKQ